MSLLGPIVWIKVTNSLPRIKMNWIHSVLCDSVYLALFLVSQSLFTGPKASPREAVYVLYSSLSTL
jgi:hypothetical protein